MLCGIKGADKTCLAPDGHRSLDSKALPVLQRGLPPALWGTGSGEDLEHRALTWIVEGSVGSLSGEGLYILLPMSLLLQDTAGWMVLRALRFLLARGGGQLGIH